MSEPFDPAKPGFWQPDQQPPTGKRAALHRLADAMRRNIELLMTTDAPEEEILAAAESLEEFADRLAEGPRHAELWGYAETATAGSTSAFFDSSPVIGRSNPIAPPLESTLVDGEVHATATFTAAYEGPPGHVHGGFVACAFDEVLGMAQSATGQAGMTGTLTIRYRKPTPLYRELRFRAHVDRVEGRKIFTSGTLHEGDTLCAEAEAVFVRVDFERIRGLAVERATSEGTPIPRQWTPRFQPPGDA